MRFCSRAYKSRSSALILKKQRFRSRAKALAGTIILTSFEKTSASDYYLSVGTLFPSA